MTVHASKGLESPIVFLPDTTAVPWLSPVNNKRRVLMDDAMPIAHLSGEMPQTLSSLLEDKRKRTEEEYKRLLYVALTRAQDRLYVAGALNETPDKFDKKLDPLSWYALARAGIEKLTPLNQAGPHFVHITAQDAPVKQDRHMPNIQAPQPLPEFARSPVIKERESVTFIAPSRLTPQPENGLSIVQPSVLYWRGTLLHRLLQILPNIIEDERSTVAERIIHNAAPDVSAAQSDELYKAAMNVIDDPRFHFLFDGTAASEVSIMAQENGRIITGQIDRLVVTEQSVWVIDYKTNRNPPRTEKDIPPHYIQQLAAYRGAIQKIYPDKTVHCALLWTELPELMPITVWN